MTKDEKIISAIKSIPLEQVLSLDYFKNRGKLFIERALIQDDQGKRELAFSDAAKAYVEQSHTSFLAIEDIDEETFFTVFQWLTTNVGSSVLEDALKATDRKIVSI